MASDNYCIICGRILPVGKQVCEWCMEETKREKSETLILGFDSDGGTGDPACLSVMTQRAGYQEFVNAFYGLEAEALYRTLMARKQYAYPKTCIGCLYDDPNDNCSSPFHCNRYRSAYVLNTPENKRKKRSTL